MSRMFGYKEQPRFFTFFIFKDCIGTFWNFLDKAAIKTAKSLAINCKCFLSNKNLCNNKNFKMKNFLNITTNIHTFNCIILDSRDTSYANCKCLFKKFLVYQRKKYIWPIQPPWLRASINGYEYDPVGSEGSGSGSGSGVCQNIHHHHEHHRPSGHHSHIASHNPLISADQNRGV